MFIQSFYSQRFLLYDTTLHLEEVLSEWISSQEKSLSQKPSHRLNTLWVGLIYPYYEFLCFYILFCHTCLSVRHSICLSVPSFICTYFKVCAFLKVSLSIWIHYSQTVKVQCSYLWGVKQICVFEHSVMTNFNCTCPAIQKVQGSGFLSEGSSWLTACMSEQRRFWRDCADAQARLNLHSHLGDKYQVRLTRPIWCAYSSDPFLQH